LRVARVELQVMTAMRKFRGVVRDRPRSRVDRQGGRRRGSEFTAHAIAPAVAEMVLCDAQVIDTSHPTHVGQKAKSTAWMLTS
jgi:hypothetical protein